MQEEEATMRELDRHLTTYGSDLSRWPDHAVEAREALLSRPDFRRAWETERDLDRGLAADRARLDAEIAGAGAVARLGRLAARRGPAGILAGVPWRRVAAAMIVAGMLGGAFDLMLPSPQPDPIEMALVDPLAGLD
jgi:hypothetical protein